MRANAAIMAAVFATATVTSAVATTPTVSDLDAVQAETIIARAKAAKAKADQELRDAAGGNVAAGVNAPADSQLPTARGLFGANGKRYVVFQYANGGMAEGIVGQVIPGNFKILAFDNTGVDLRAASGKRHRIPFSLQAPAAPVVQPAAPSALPNPFTAVPPIR